MIRLVLSSKFASPTLIVGPMGTLVIVGMENSWRVFSAISVEADGVEARGFVGGRVASGRTR